MKGLMILMMCVFWCGLASPVIAMGDVGFMQETLAGAKAQDFTLNTVKDKKINFEQYRAGKNAILFFWATWCPHCRDALKEINAMRQQIESKGIALVFISIGESKGTVENYLSNHQYDFDVALDQTQSLDGPYQIIGVPTIVYVGQDGTIKSVEHSFSGNFEEKFK